MAKKHMEAHDGKLGKEEPLKMDEIGNPGSIEKVAETDFDDKEAELEAFMNEMVTVVVQQDASKNAVQIPLITVNRLNQGFIRGQKVKCRRKYVEALARSRVTDYEQVRPDPNNPDNIKMQPITALAYPFVVVEDKNPKGQAWLDAILAQPG
jgi:hypothetical protein